MKQSFPHQLSQNQSREVARRAFASYIEKLAEYHPNFNWHDDDNGELSFKVMGKEVRGIISLLPGEILVEMKVPLLLKPFRSKALQVIGREINKWVELAETE